MVKQGKGKQKIKSMISPTTCQFLGSKTIIASGFVEDVTGQCATGSAATHKQFLLKIT